MARPPARTLSLRGLVLGVAALEGAIWLLFVWNGLFSGSDPATRGIDRDVAIMATGVFLGSGLPAFSLAAWNRWLPFAVVLALLPLAALIVLMLWSTMT